MSIRTRLLLLILFATLVPALEAGWQFYQRRDAEIAGAQRDLVASAQRTAQALRDQVRATAQLLHGLSRARDLDTPDRTACSEFLAGVLKQNPQYTSLATIRTDGTLVCDSLRTGRQLNLQDRRYFQQALRPGSSLAVQPVFGRLTGSAVLQIAYPARSANGEPAFVLLASLDLARLMDRRATGLPRSNETLALVGSEGTILTWHPEGDKLRGSPLADKLLLRFAREHPQGAVREFDEANGASRIWAVAAMPEFPEAGLHVLVGVGGKDLLAAANRNMVQALAILAVVTLLAFAGAWALVEVAIRRQVARVLRAVTRFGNGQFGARIGTPYPRGEIGLLMAALDRSFELTQSVHQRVVRSAEVLARSNRALNMLSRVNRTLTQSRAEDALLHDLCLLVVNAGGYRRCWVGYVGLDATSTIRPVAQAGCDVERLHALGLSCADDERGQGPVSRAIRTGVPVMETNIPQDAESAARLFGAQEGDASLIALPLTGDGQVLGALVIYAGESDRFAQQEVKLLGELVADMGYGIHSLRSRAELDRHRAKLEALVQQQAAAAQALQESEARTRLTIETAMDALVGMDARGLVTDWNAQAQVMFGWTRAEVLGRPMGLLLIPPQHRDAHTRGLAHFLATGEGPMLGRRIEVMAWHREGREFPVELAVSPFKVQGAWMFTAFLRDVSERKAVEERTRNLNQELEERVQERTAELEAARQAATAASHAKSTFLATMSHEIRTPLNGMFGMLELLGLTRLDAEQRATLQVVRESGDSLLRIIDDILDFSKIEAGKLELRPEPVAIDKLVEDVRNTYSGSASSKGLLLLHSSDARISPRLMVDPVRLRQILNNFLSNAVKFTFEGSIEIRAELAARSGGCDRLRFSVRDTGVGISGEEQQRLFQPFSQGDGAAAQQAGGTGLGLTICRRLAEMMGGSVVLVSEPGKGTTLTLCLSLPIAQVARGEQAPAEAPGLAALPTLRAPPSTEQAEEEGTLVLVVDDHPINRQLLARQVRTLGYAVESAEDGVQALELWKSGRFGVVITDCNMPRMDGYEFARRVRQLENSMGFMRVPIIAYTANAMRGTAEVCIAAGMDDFLTKPIELRKLDERLQHWVPIPQAAAMTGAAHLQPEPASANGLGVVPIDISFIGATWGADDQTIAAILADFRRINDEDVAALRAAGATRDTAAVIHSAHRMLGAGKMVGAEDFARVCERINRAARASDWESVGQGMQALERELTRLNLYLDALDGLPGQSRVGSSDRRQADTA